MSIDSPDAGNVRGRTIALVKRSLNQVGFVLFSNAMVKRSVGRWFWIEFKSHRASNDFARFEVSYALAPFVLQEAHGVPVDLAPNPWRYLSCFVWMKKVASPDGEAWGARSQADPAEFARAVFRSIQEQAFPAFFDWADDREILRRLRDSRMRWWGGEHCRIEMLAAFTAFYGTKPALDELIERLEQLQMQAENASPEQAAAYEEKLSRLTASLVHAPKMSVSYSSLLANRRTRLTHFAARLRKIHESRTDRA